MEKMQIFSLHRKCSINRSLNYVKMILTILSVYMFWFWNQTFLPTWPFIKQNNTCIAIHKLYNIIIKCYIQR